MRKLALIALLLFVSPSLAETKFLKVTKENNIPRTVETATVTYEKDGKTVDLVSAIHIGDYSYYSGLNTQFKDYDTVLYELVGPKNAKPDKKGNSLYKIIGIFLNLDSQTRVIDYKAKNFVHADLTPEEMSKAIKARGHNVYSIIMSAAAEMIQKHNLQKNQPQFDFSKYKHDDTAVYYKRILAHQMEGSATASGIMHTLLVEDRNNRALKVFKDEMNKGTKNIAIFYGAAHMPDFEDKLEEMGFKKTKTTWQVAWEIKPQKAMLLRLLLD